jgi:type I restriction enzyme M protein
MTTKEIVDKLWNLCNVLRDDGITYHQYVTELTYILFLKMAQETGAEDNIPETYRWNQLKSKEGVELKNFYRQLLLDLGDEHKTKGTVQKIYHNAQTSIDHPANLEKIIKSIDQLDWYSAKQEGLGDLYEGLLEKNAGEKKSGAGQYFTPRALINVMVRCIAPQPGERCHDPAMGTFGFMIACDHYLRERYDDYYAAGVDAQFQRTHALSGIELVQDAYRLALMNAMLHDLSGGMLLQGDTLSQFGEQFMERFDVVLTNPPFGTKKGGERPTHGKLTFKTLNKQLNFVQHIYRSLKPDGKARAGVVIPDNVLFVGGDGQNVRADLMDKCDLHTILRLPGGTFDYAGVATNVLFFRRGTTDKANTREVWFYDLRSDMPSFGKRTPGNVIKLREKIRVMFVVGKQNQTQPYEKRVIKCTNF